MVYHVHCGILACKHSNISQLAEKVILHDNHGESWLTVILKLTKMTFFIKHVLKVQYVKFLLWNIQKLFSVKK